MKKMCPKGKGRVMAAKGESIRTEKKKNLCERGRKSKREGKEDQERGEGRPGERGRKSKRKGKKICAGD